MVVYESRSYKKPEYWGKLLLRKNVVKVVRQEHAERIQKHECLSKRKSKKVGRNKIFKPKKKILEESSSEAVIIGDFLSV